MTRLRPGFYSYSVLGYLIYIKTLIANMKMKFTARKRDSGLVIALLPVQVQEKQFLTIKHWLLYM